MTDRPIPDERDQIEVPRRPDLRCREHEGLCEVAHSLHDRIVKLEGEVAMLKGLLGEREVRRG